MTQYEDIEGQDETAPLAYPGLRSFLGEDYRDASPMDLETLVAQRFPGVPPAHVEDWFSTVTQLAPSIIQGAVKGGTTGAVMGPWGIVGGALAGGTMSGIKASKSLPDRRPSAGASPRHSLAAAPTGGLLGGGTSAAAHALRLLDDPIVMQAISAMALGTAGRPTVSSGDGRNVPAARIISLLGALLNRASSEYAMETAQHEAVPSPSARSVVRPRQWEYAPIGTVRRAPSLEWDEGASDYDAIDEAELAYGVSAELFA